MKVQGERITASPAHWRWPDVSAECARSVVAAGRDLTGTIGQALWLVLDEVQSLRQEVNGLRDDVSRLHEVLAKVK